MTTATARKVLVSGSWADESIVYTNSTYLDADKLTLTAPYLSSLGYEPLRSGKDWAVSLVVGHTVSAAFAASDLSGHTITAVYHDPHTQAYKGALTVTETDLANGTFGVSAADTDTVYPGMWRLSVLDTDGSAAKIVLCRGWIEILPALATS